MTGQDTKRAEYNTPAVSIVVTCYNYGKYLSDCISSVLAQAYDDYEIIIVNDGSTDDSHEVVQPFLSDPRIRYIHQENAGQANAKNTGTRNAKGQFIAFLDADDQWHSTKLEKQIPLFEDPKVGVVYSRARYIDERGRDLDLTLTGKYLQPRAGRATNSLIFDNFIPFSSSVVRRECLEQYGSFDESIYMGIDWDLWLRISTKYDFAYVDEPLLFYRLGHSGQMSKNMEKRYRCSDVIMKKFFTLYPDILDKTLISEAFLHTYCGRAYYYSKQGNLRQAVKYNWKALGQNPSRFVLYKYFIENIVRSLLRAAKK